MHPVNYLIAGFLSTDNFHRLEANPLDRIAIANEVTRRVNDMVQASRFVGFAVLVVCLFFQGFDQVRAIIDVYEIRSFFLGQNFDIEGKDAVFDGGVARVDEDGKARLLQKHNVGIGCALRLPILARRVGINDYFMIGIA